MLRHVFDEDEDADGVRRGIIIVLVLIAVLQLEQLLLGIATINASDVYVSVDRRETATVAVVAKNWRQEVRTNMANNRCNDCNSIILVLQDSLILLLVIVIIYL
jgi:hypothetical protein